MLLCRDREMGELLSGVFLREMLLTRSLAFDPIQKLVFFQPPHFCSVEGRTHVEKISYLHMLHCPNFRAREIKGSTGA